MTPLNTTAKAIDALGGNSAVAELLGTNSKAVANWRSFGRFPAHSYIVLRGALSRRKYAAPVSLWKMTLPKKRRRTSKSA